MKAESMIALLGATGKGILTSAILCFLLTGDLFAAPLNVRFVTFNVDFSNSSAKVEADIAKIEPRSDIIMFQEAKNVTIDNFMDSDWTVYQVVNQGDAKRGSALAIRNSIMTELLATGLRFGVGRNGEDMLDRYIAWADVKLTNGRILRVMSLHMPPQRIAYLQPIMADNLKTFMDVTPYPVVIGGDWNFTVNNDPHGIRSANSLASKGVGIDGFYYKASIAEFVSINEMTGLNVESDHDPVQMISSVSDLPSGVADWVLYH